MTAVASTCLALALAPLVAQAGGNGWSVQTSGLTATTLDGVSFPDCLNGWAVGSRPDTTENVAFDKTLGTIVHTSNGGQTWSPQQPAGITHDLESVSFVDSQYGWVGEAGGKVLYTTNGGTSWTEVTPNGSTSDIEGISFVNHTTGYASTIDGKVFTTTTGGQTAGAWTKVYDNSGANEAEGITASDATHAWTGIDGNPGGSIYGNGGTSTFTVQTGSGTHEVEGLAFVDNVTGWATGASSTLLHTTNGTTWSAQTPPTLNGTDFESVAFADRNNGWFVTAFGEIATTTDGGTTWTKQTSPVEVASSPGGDLLTSVVFHTKSRGWAVGANGNIISHTGAPTVTGISPVSGASAGATSVTVNGCGLLGATGVNFGTTAGSSVHVINDTQLTVTSPPHAAGPVDVSVTTPFGTSAVSAADTFTFVAPPPSPSPTPALPKAGGYRPDGGGEGPWVILAVVLLAVGGVVARWRTARS